MKENIVRGTGNGAHGQIQGAADVVSNIPNYTAADYQYGAGFVLEKGVELLVMKKVGDAASFKLNGGNGLFGKKDLKLVDTKSRHYMQTNKVGEHYFL